MSVSASEQAEDRLLHGLVDRSYRLSFANELLDGLSVVKSYDELAAAAIPPLLEITGARAGWLRLDEWDSVPMPGELTVPGELVAALEAASEERPGFRIVHSGSIYMAAFPITAQDKHLGEAVLVGDHSRVEQLLGVVGWLQTLCSPIGLTAANLRHLEEIHQLAMRDGLTGLYNHAHFQRQLKAEVDRARRYNAEFSLVMIDIDHFKQINDRFGHQAGDAVLIKVAGLVQASMRQSDLAARYGGEELVLLLPETPLEGALNVAERLRTAIAALELAFLDGLALESVTASFGIALFQRDTDGPESVIKRADLALYEAKHRGRDRVCTEAEPAPAAPTAPEAGARKPAPAAKASAPLPSAPPVRVIDTLLSATDSDLAEDARLKCDFLSNASHELRTPLAAIVGYAELLEDHLGGPLTPEQEEFVSQIQHGAQRLDTLFNEMLDGLRAVG